MYSIIKPILNTLNQIVHNMRSKALPYPQSHESAHRYFASHGISISRWARDMGLPRSSVNAVLFGRNQGLRGHAHKAAVALGLKPRPKE